MNKNAIFEKIVAIISEMKGETLDLSLETTVEESIAEDSVEVMEFILTLEDEFGITISDEAIEGFKSLGNVVEYIVQQQ